MCLKIRCDSPVGKFLELNRTLISFLFLASFVVFTHFNLSPSPSAGCASHCAHGRSYILYRDYWTYDYDPSKHAFWWAEKKQSANIPVVTISFLLFIPTLVTSKTTLSGNCISF